MNDSFGSGAFLASTVNVSVDFESTEEKLKRLIQDDESAREMADKISKRTRFIESSSEEELVTEIEGGGDPSNKTPKLLQKVKKFFGIK